MPTHKPISGDFGGSGISESMYKWIVEHLPAGKHILELGSGDASTRFLSSFYKMTSVEHDPAYVNKYRSRYILAPIVNGWYDVKILNVELPHPDDYDLLLVDGPVGSVPRAGFLKNIALFNVNVPIIIDDTWRDVEKQMAVDIAAEYGHELIVDEFWSVLIPPSPPDCSAQSAPAAEAQSPTP